MIDEMAFQHLAEAGDARATMEAIADGLEVSSGGESPSHANILAQQRPGDARGRLEGDHNA